jgi:TonB family protein
MRRIEEYDRKWHKRLIILLPVSLVVLLTLVLTLDRTKVVKRIFTVGYEGAERFVPEITIIDDSDLESDVTMKQRDAMKAEDILLESEAIVSSDDSGDEPSREVEHEGKNPSLGLAESEDLFRIYPSRAKVPYRENYVILKMIEPIYPLYALENGMEGYVLVEAYISERGSVESVWVRTAYGDKSFEESAVDAVEQFLFKPAKEAGKPIPFWVSFLIRFELKH